MSSLFGICGGGNVGAAGGGSFYSYSIQNSLRLDGSTAYLSKNDFGTSTDTTKRTFSTWVKRGDTEGVAAYNHIIGAGSSSIDGFGFQSGTAKLQWIQGGSVTKEGVRDLRDTSAWYHFFTTWNATDNELFIYVNGELDYSDTGSLSALSKLGNTGHTTYIGRRSNVATYIHGYLAETVFLDGYIGDVNDFGELVNGIWVPKDISAASLTYGTNGFYLDYADSSDLGKDVSGKGNHFTSNGLAAEDQVPDSPTNNWCTFNPLDQNDVTGLTYPTTYSEGNLKLTQATGFINRKATFGMTGGKWYWEIKINDSSPDSFFGVSKSTGDARGALDNDEAMIRLTNGNLYTNAAETSYGTAFSNGDVCILAVDMDAGKFWAGRNGTWFASGDPAAGTNEGKSGLASELFPSVSLADGENCDVNFGQNGTFNGTKTAGGNSDGNGYGDFLYTVPSGFLALNSANLPEPTISPNADEQADDYFNTVLYTGNGVDDRSITGVGFQPDWVWLKSRSNATNHYLCDVVRGANKLLLTNGANSEADVSNNNRIQAFESDGFQLGSDAEINGSARTYVAWNWKAGGTAVSNTDGSITSSVSANQDAGFSIVSYTGTGSNATVGHGLTKKPEWLVTKSRDSALNWSFLQINDMTTDKVMALQATNGEFSSPGSFIENDFNATTFGVGTETPTNKSGDDFICYCFHSVDGYSKVGSYVGNGSTDGVFVFTNFAVRFLLIKETGNANSWEIYDTARDPDNVASQRLFPNTSAAEATTNPSLDMLSNGFKARAGNTGINRSGGNYIYLAFAEAPFKYANAR